MESESDNFAGIGIRIGIRRLKLQWSRPGLGFGMDQVRAESEILLKAGSNFQVKIEPSPGQVHFPLGLDLDLAKKKSSQVQVET